MTTTPASEPARPGPPSADEVLAVLQIAVDRHRGPVTIAELAWVWAADIEWAHRNDPGPQVVVDPASRDLAVLARRLRALRANRQARTAGDRPQKWHPISAASISGTRTR